MTIKAGDTVRIARKDTEDPWVGYLEVTIGDVLTVECVHPDGDAKLSNGYWYPLSVLEKQDVIK